MEKSLDRTLGHATISDQVFIHLPLHDPLPKPNELIVVFYTFILVNKIVITITATVTLFTISFTFLMYFLRTANRTFFFLIFYGKKKQVLKPISILADQKLAYTELAQFFCTIFDHIVIFIYSWMLSHPCLPTFLASLTLSRTIHRQYFLEGLCILQLLFLFLLFAQAVLYKHDLQIDGAFHL